MQWPNTTYPVNEKEEEINKKERKSNIYVCKMDKGGKVTEIGHGWNFLYSKFTI